MEVRGVPGKTYHYFNEFGPAVTVNTRVDWRGAAIAIHDERLERRCGRSPATRVFRLSNTDSADRITIENPDWTIGTDTKSLADKPEVMEAVGAFRARGFDEFFCIVKNEDHKRFIRYGGNANNGEARQDRFKLDSAGNLLHDVIWDFGKITPALPSGSRAAAGPDSFFNSKPALSRRTRMPLSFWRWKIRRAGFRRENCSCSARSGGRWRPVCAGTRGPEPDKTVGFPPPALPGGLRTSLHTRRGQPPVRTGSAFAALPAVRKAGPARTARGGTAGSALAVNLLKNHG